MTGSGPEHAAPDPMGDWAQIRSDPESPAPTAAAPQQASPQNAGEPERKKLLTVGLAMILAALTGAVIYGLSLPTQPEPPAAPRLAVAEQRQVSVQSPSAQSPSTRSPPAQPSVAPAAPRTAPPAAPNPTQAPPRRPQPELRAGPGQPLDTGPDASLPSGPAAMQSRPADAPNAWLPSATFNALPDCDEPILRHELTWLAGLIPELWKAKERTTAMERATANGNSPDGTRACRADLRTTDNLYQVALSLKVVDGVIEVTFLSLRKYVRGQPGAVVLLRPAHVLPTTLAVVPRQPPP